MKTTKSMFAQLNRIEPEAAYKLLDYLQTVKLVRNVGNAPKAEGVRGRGESIYEGDSEAIHKHLAGLTLNGIKS